MKRKKKLFLLPILLLLLVLAGIAAAVAGRSAMKKETDYREKARIAYTEGDFETALLYLRRNSSLSGDHDSLMLMADCYEAMGNYPRALETLRKLDTGDPSVAKRIQSVEQKRDLQSHAETISIAGTDFAPNAKEAVLDGRGITDEDIRQIATLYALDRLSLRNNEISDVHLLMSLGGLDELDLSGNRVSDISALSSLKELRLLNLEDNPVSDFTPLYGLSALNTLLIENTKITEGDLEKLAAMLPSCTIRCNVGEESEILLGSLRFQTAATELDLSGKGIRDISALGECGELVSLNLSNNSISDLQPLMKLPKLAKLNIADNNVSDLRPLIGLPQLMELDASNNLISDASAVGNIAQLRILTLSGNSMTDFGGLSKLSKLETLTLQNTGVDDAALHDLTTLKMLRILDVTENIGLSARAVESLKQTIPSCSILCSELVYDVDFSGHLVRSDETNLALPSCGIQTLNGIERLTAIETLNLRGNQIESVYSIQISQARDTLVDLNLADNRINNVDSLVALTRIEKLDLSGNQITVINPLMQLDTLRTLNLTGNPIEADQVAILRAALPNCEVFF